MTLELPKSPGASKEGFALSGRVSREFQPLFAKARSEVRIIAQRLDQFIGSGPRVVGL